MECGEGVSPSPRGEGSEEGAVPPPQKFFLILDHEIAFLARSGRYIFTIQLPALRTESGYIHVGDRYI